MCLDQVGVRRFYSPVPFSTSRTVVVSAKISRKYSGGVLRGSIPAREDRPSTRTGGVLRLFRREVDWRQESGREEQESQFHKAEGSSKFGRM